MCYDGIVVELWEEHFEAYIIDIIMEMYYVRMHVERETSVVYMDVYVVKVALDRQKVSIVLL